MFPASTSKPIDEILKNAVEKIEAQNSNLSVFAARQFRYSLRQSIVELTIKEPRQFNVLEEFIIRAAIEFEPPPTADELASVLGLDAVFVKSTISTLQTLQTLATTKQITVTPEGHLFYEKGTVSKPPYSIQIYAISDSLAETITFQSESLDDVTVNLPDLGKFVNIDHNIHQISTFSLEEIQQMLEDSGLAIHVPEEGKMITDFRVLAASKIIWKPISLFVIFNVLEDKLNIQISRGKQILEVATKRINSLLKESKISLLSLCELSDEAIKIQREEILKKSQNRDLSETAILPQITPQNPEKKPPKTKKIDPN
ncbi:hypothetical protein [Trichormus variabilis]|uniref:Uncharacterized protein n=1 Tax=Trichormus variabilis SAG 1403-4b TaxID=447716 RepID=A0A433UQI7_ANAVA|nr:hypothetical protein [Trichormus variabilis]MBD2626353.1 hypothetical protein [Trichormus variabilis FACHB-164]RUS96111.1 hypothetical protein DSM107003_27730 [Trichormus variabilis SAG 1403-4b]